MRVTQGAFSFLPDFTDEQIAAQIRYALDKGWSMSVEYTDDPHPRNSYWDMWGQPYFDLLPEDFEVVLREVRACREAHPDHYVKLIAYDAAPWPPDDRAELHRQPARDRAGVPRRARRHPRPGRPLPADPDPMTALQAVAVADERLRLPEIAIDIEPVLAELDRELVALAPVKSRIREIAALLVVDGCVAARA